MNDENFLLVIMMIPIWKFLLLFFEYVLDLKVETRNITISITTISIILPYLLCHIHFILIIALAFLCFL